MLFNNHRFSNTPIKQNGTKEMFKIAFKLIHIFETKSSWISGDSITEEKHRADQWARLESKIDSMVKRTPQSYRENG